MFANRQYVPLIVSEADFARAQQIEPSLTNPPRKGPRREYDWPLSGAVRCGLCNRTLIGMATGVTPWRYRYYACKSGIWSEAHEGKIFMVRADDLEKQVAHLIGRLRVDPAAAEKYAKRAATPISQVTLERTIRDLKAKRSHVERGRDAVFEAHAKGTGARRRPSGALRPTRRGARRT